MHEPIHCEKEALRNIPAPEHTDDKIYSTATQNSHLPLACMESLQANQLLCLHSEVDTNSY